MTIKKGFLCLILLLPSANPSANPYPAGDNNQFFLYGIETDFNSQYIWRGLSYNRGFIIQPSPWVSFSNFTLNIWGNFPLYDLNSAEGTEIDFTATYLLELDALSIEPSLNYYNYPGQTEAPSTAEGNLKFSWNFSDWEIYSNLNVDIIEYSGSFTSDAGIVFEQCIWGTTMSADLNAGWAGKKFIQSFINPEYTGSSFNYLSISLSANYYLNENIYLKPHAEYFRILSSVLKEVSGSHLSNFGILIGTEF